MALSTFRDTTVILIDHTSFTPWRLQLEAYAQALKVWNLINPDSTNEPKQEPVQPEPPLVSDYAAANGHDPDEPIEYPSQLSPAGNKAYKEDYKYFRGQFEIYKACKADYTCQIEGSIRNLAQSS